jgi:hypothetical protein
MAAGSGGLFSCPIIRPQRQNRRTRITTVCLSLADSGACESQHFYARFIRLFALDGGSRRANLSTSTVLLPSFDG